MNAASTETERLRFLDGLRGLAALCVIVHHFVAAFLPVAYFGASGKAGHEMQDWFSSSPLVVFYNGPFAVYVFFALSGFVISRSVSGSGTPFPLLAGRRYLRLAVPMLASTLLAFALVKAFPHAAIDAARAQGNGWLAEVYYERTFSIAQAVWDGVLNAFRFGDAYSNRVLWTMRVELFGSLAIYAVYRLVPARYLSLAFAGALVLLIPKQWQLTTFADFAGGALLFQAWQKGLLRERRAAPLLVLAGMLLGMLTLRPEADGNLRALVQIAGLVSKPAEFILGTGALLLLAGVLMWPAAQRGLQHPWCRFLGRVSFSLYLVHIPLLGTVGCYAWLHLDMGSWRLGALAIAYVAASLSLAYLMTRIVDEPVTTRLKRARELPRSRTVWMLHLGLLAGALGFALSRLGFDLRSLVVLLLAYAGLVVVLPLILMRTRAADRPVREVEGAA
jgi:peptidoglycan/LPS O-acetylase OafA/YrhL